MEKEGVKSQVGVFSHSLKTENCFDKKANSKTKQNQKRSKKVQKYLHRKAVKAISTQTITKQFCCEIIHFENARKYLR